MPEYQPKMTWAKQPNGTTIGTPIGAQPLQAHQTLSNPMPAAANIEEAVLGAMLLDADAYILSQSGVPIVGSDFYREKNQLIWAAIEALGRANFPIDLLTVTERLKMDGNLDAIGGPYYLVELSNRVASSANVEYHARILRQYAIKRGIIKTCYEATAKAYREDVDCFELLEDVQCQLSSQIDNIGGTELNIMKTTDTILRDATNPEQGKCYTKTGFPNLDAALGGGFHEEDRIILLAGKPGSGKTSFCLTTIISNMENGEPTAFYSFDMSAKEIVFRLIACKSGVNALDMRRGRTTQADSILLMQTRDWIEARLHLLIVINAIGMRGNVMIAKMVALSKTMGVKNFIVDYFTAIPLDSNGNRSGTETQAQNTFIDSMKETVIKINARIIMLVQFTKEGAKKEARLALVDIKGTGELGNAATIAIIINRDGDSSSGEFDIVKARLTRPQIVDASYFGGCYRWDCGKSESEDILGAPDGLDEFEF